VSRRAASGGRTRSAADLYERRRCSAIKELGFFACGAVRSSKGEPLLLGGRVEETGGNSTVKGCSRPPAWSHGGPEESSGASHGLNRRFRTLTQAGRRIKIGGRRNGLFFDQRRQLSPLWLDPAQFRSDAWAKNKGVRSGNRAPWRHYALAPGGGTPALCRRPRPFERGADGHFQTDVGTK
jgi:hypothetical protein